MKKKVESSSLSSDELYEMLKNKKKNQKSKATKSLTDKNSKSKKTGKKIKEDEKDKKTVEVKEEQRHFKSDKAMVAKKDDVDNTIVKRILSGEYIYFDDVDKEYETISHDDFEGYVDVDTHDITKVVSEARFNSDYHESLVDDDEFGTVRMGRKIDDSRIIDKSLSNGKWYKDIDKTRELDTIIPIDDINKKKKLKIRWSAVIVTLIFILLFITALILIVWI